MKTISLLIALAITATVSSQKYIDMSQLLSNMNGHTTIDGNALQVEHNTREQIIITGQDMVLNEKSSFLFRNIIVQLSGKIRVKGISRPYIMDSYIFCKNASGLKSKFIIETKNTDRVMLAKVDYIKSLKGNPDLWVYDMAGKRVAKGKKNDLAETSLPVSQYDVKVVGIEFKEKVLFVEL